METRGAPNDDRARYWNGEEAGHWLVHEHRYERMLAPFTDRLLGAAALARADRVLDVGYGTGSDERPAGSWPTASPTGNAPPGWSACILATNPTNASTSHTQPKPAGSLVPGALSGIHRNLTDRFPGSVEDSLVH
jgi:hypothetical protein